MGFDNFNLSLNFSTTKFILWYTIGLKALYEQKWIGKIVILWINFEENIVIFGLILDLKKKKEKNWFNHLILEKGFLSIILFSNLHCWSSNSYLYKCIFRVTFYFILMGRMKAQLKSFKKNEKCHIFSVHFMLRIQDRKYSAKTWINLRIFSMFCCNCLFQTFSLKLIQNVQDRPTRCSSAPPCHDYREIYC